MTSVSAGAAGRIFSSLTARRSISCGRRSVSSSRRSCRLTSASCVRVLAELFHLAAGVDDLEVLPRREEQHGDDEPGDAERPHELAALRPIDLADDRVVPDVLLDGVFDVDAHAIFSTTRNFALRARGLRRISSSPGTTGRRVTSDTAPAGGALAEPVLHDPVLERVERDHCQPAAGREDGDGAVQELLEPRQLVVHPDPERLKRSRRRIDPRPGPSAGGAPHRRRQRAGVRQPAFVAGPKHRARDAPRVPLFAESRDDVGERRFVHGREPLGQRLAARSIRAHVERPGLAEAESAGGIVELHRRHAQIRQDAPHFSQTPRLQAPARSPDNRRARNRCDRPTVASCCRALGERRRVAIDPDQPIGARLARAPRCPPSPTVASTNTPPVSRPEMRDDLGHQHRFVGVLRSQTPPAPARRRP